MSTPSTRTPDPISRLIQGLSAEELAEMIALTDEIDARKRASAAQTDFLAFIGAMDAKYKFGTHLKRLGRLLMDMEEGTKDRLAVSVAPRFGKSQMISIYFPAWYIGRNPDHKMLIASHTSDLATDMARKVRNLMQTTEYRAIFPGVSISADAKAAGKWTTNKGGEMYAVGVGGAVAGRGGDIVIVDDPISEQALKTGNFEVLDTVYEWFTTGIRTRLMPNARIAVLHCLVGDTQVAMADGTEKTIRDVRPDDMVLSYDAGQLRPAKVLGWSNQGLDRVYAIALRSGVILRGNERHPFLVSQDGVEQWVKIKDLKPGMRLVSTRAAAGHQSPKPSAVHAKPASPGRTTTNTTLGAHSTPLATTASGKVWSALRKAAVSLPTPMGCVLPAETRPNTPSERPKAPTTARKSAATPTSKCSTGSPAWNTTACTPISVGGAQYAGSLLTMETPPARGKSGGWRSTIATGLAAFARFCATAATSSSRTKTASSGCKKPSSIWSTTLDEILTITPDGEEEVFDIQVEGTENFIANGVVSHNTRWHQRDLIGRLIKDSAMNPEADQYEIYEFPAILHADDPPNMKSLWPEQWTLEALLRTKATMPAWQWNAQYMQDPTAADSAIIKREWIRWWQTPNPPEVSFILQSWDTALTTKERSDWSVCLTWGVWQNEDDKTQNVILLNAVKGKWEFPDLKEAARKQFEQWQPDGVIVEAKASGQPLIDEMRRSGIFVQDYSPGKGQDKIARVNSVADMFASGQVWFPETVWAQEVVEEILAFPSGLHDDQVDATSLALIRFRKGGLIRLESDPADNDDDSRPRARGYTI